jgi:hypothetical protein
VGVRAPVAPSSLVSPARESTYTTLPASGQSPPLLDELDEEELLDELDEEPLEEVDEELELSLVLDRLLALDEPPAELDEPLDALPLDPLLRPEVALDIEAALLDAPLPIAPELALDAEEVVELVAPALALVSPGDTTSWHPAPTSTSNPR